MEKMLNVILLVVSTLSKMKITHSARFKWIA